VIDDYVEKVLAEAPRLTDEQRTLLAELLKPVRQSITLRQNVGYAHRITYKDSAATSRR
jgi:hypothetical protein